jgi:hypothetical protein
MKIDKPGINQILVEDPQDSTRYIPLEEFLKQHEEIDRELLEAKAKRTVELHDN